MCPEIPRAKEGLRPAVSGFLLSSMDLRTIVCQASVMGVLSPVQVNSTQTRPRGPWFSPLCCQTAGFGLLKASLLTRSRMKACPKRRCSHFSSFSHPPASLVPLGLSQGGGVLWGRRTPGLSWGPWLGLSLSSPCLQRRGPLRAASLPPPLPGPRPVRLQTAAWPTSRVPKPWGGLPSKAGRRLGVGVLPHSELGQRGPALTWLS